MQNLKRIFFFWMLGMLVLISLFAAFGPEGKKINLKTVEFTTTESASIYFKNIRSYFYDQESYKDGSYVLYRIDSRELDSSKNKLNAVIVRNHLQNQCFIRFESGLVKLDQEPLRLAWQHADSSGIVQLSSADSFGHYILAADLFEKLDLEADVSLLMQEKRIPFKEKEKKSLRKSLYDYFRLVGKLR